MIQKTTTLIKKYSRLLLGIGALFFFAVWLLVEGFTWKDLSANLFGELAGIFVTVLIIDSLNELRAERELKARLIREMCSRDNIDALRAVGQLEARGWLYDGSLKGADLDGANLNGANLKRAALNLADLDHSDLRNANLSSVNLSHALMMEADLRNADLRWANLTGVAMEEANLRGANLGSANLSMANLTGAKVSPDQLTKAETLEGATMPDGTLYKPEESTF
jgi:hypothetical protein